MPVDYFLVIQAGKFETCRRLVSRASGAGSVAAAGAEADCVSIAVATAEVAVCCVCSRVSAAAGAGVIPAGFTPYGFGVPSGGAQAP
jgi:hypothetical protein